MIQTFSKWINIQQKRSMVGLSESFRAAVRSMKVNMRSLEWNNVNCSINTQHVFQFKFSKEIKPTIGWLSIDIMKLVTFQVEPSYRYHMRWSSCWGSSSVSWFSFSKVRRQSVRTSPRALEWGDCQLQSAGWEHKLRLSGPAIQLVALTVPLRNSVELTT